MPSLNAQLSKRIDETLTPLIAGRSERICIIDPPGYANVGDSAIFLGELAFLRRNFPGARIDFFDTVNYTPACDRFIRDSSIILLQGGGNFGEIWPRHHAIRMEILNRFPGKPIVQFPQSISFTTQAGIEATARAIERQGNFTLLVRDRRSQAFAEQNFTCATVPCPDMAFALGDIQREPASLDFLCLLRQDKEMVTDHPRLLKILSGLGGSLDVADWIEAPNSRLGQRDKALGATWRRHPWTIGLTRSFAFSVRERYARERLAFGLGLLSKGSMVITDRLHAHVLCCLLGVRHLLFDSLDGKVSALYEAWTKDTQHARLVSSVDQVAGLVYDFR
ncbi:polysaccharide pyruvyl transferase family protein [Dongia deserti]|uniref:polysaccharide pyruvyl transferase family protein n=1 Tax=Dongia deserti TaxID=2268030 RepID=UPI000E65BDCF|nr:polysaccharide pyruvyl transferase family protein [Dongia deserti]